MGEADVMLVEFIVGARAGQRRPLECLQGGRNFVLFF